MHGQINFSVLHSYDFCMPMFISFTWKKELYKITVKWAEREGREATRKMII